MPIAMCGLGGLWSERAGVVNIGLEGMMIMGTLGAGYFGFHYGVWAGVARRHRSSGCSAARCTRWPPWSSASTTSSPVSPSTSSPLGVAGFLAEAWFSGLEGGGPTQSPPLPTPPEIDLPFIADPMNTLEDKHWFLISDLAGVVEMFTKNLCSLDLIGLVLIFGTTWAAVAAPASGCACARAVSHRPRPRRWA